jgi:uncharacterized RDD family membrane protein YckC
MNENKMKPTVAPSVLKLGACLIYEALTVTALGLVLTGLFLWIAGDATYGLKRGLLQLFLWIAIGSYFVWCWVKTGQTLAMQAWQLKLVNQEAELLTVRAAVLRYILASVNLMLLGLGFLLAVFDKDRLFLHDRLLKSRIILLKNNK